MSSSKKGIEKEMEQLCCPHPIKHTAFNVGDTVSIFLIRKQGDKEKIQKWGGIVLRIRGDSYLNRTFMVRKISGTTALIRNFSYASPNIKSIAVIRKGRVRRARLYYLKDKYGKSFTVKRKK